MRLRVLLVVLILGFGLGGQASSVAQEGDHDVPMFRGNAARTGVMPGPGPDSANGIAVLWRFTTGHWINSSPAVVDGVVYVGSYDHKLYAIDAASGEERWKFATGDGIFSSPAVVDGVVYVGSWGGTFFAIGTRPITLETGGLAVIREGTALRAAPARSGVERTKLEPGEAVEIFDEPVTTAGEIWWPVRVVKSGKQGWVLADALEPTANAPQSTPTPEP